MCHWHCQCIYNLLWFISACTRTFFIVLWSHTQWTTLPLSLILLQVHDNEFVLSFLHKPHTDITTKFYYAFTFPFTYTDCQNQLARFDTLYRKSADEMKYILRRLNVVDVDTDVDGVDVNCNTINYQSQDTTVDAENVQNHFNGMCTIRFTTACTHLCVTWWL